MPPLGDLQTVSNSATAAEVFVPVTDGVTLSGNGFAQADGGNPFAVLDNGISNAKLADVASETIKGRLTNGTGDPEDLTVAQVQGMLNVDDLIALSGVADGDTDLGTFTGTTIGDNLTIKDALQAIETAIESLSFSLADGDYGDIRVFGSGTIMVVDIAAIDTSKIADDAVTADKLADTGVTAGSYNSANITVDAQGRITAASDGASTAYTTTTVNGARITYRTLSGTPVITFDTTTATAPVLSVSGGTIRLKEVRHTVNPNPATSTNYTYTFNATWADAEDADPSDVNKKKIPSGQYDHDTTPQILSTGGTTSQVLVTINAVSENMKLIFSWNNCE